MRAAPIHHFIPVCARRLAFLAAFALAISACGSGGGGTSATSGSGESALKIGLAVSLTGKNAEPGQDTLRGVQLWVKDVNAKGGILGHKVKLIHYDDQSDPHTSAKLAEKLITQDHVSYLIGPYSSGAEQAAAVVSEKHKVPMIAPGAASDSNFQRGFKYSFQTYTPASKQMEPYVKLAEKHGYQTVAVVHSDDPFSNDAAKGAVAVAKDAGLRVVYEEKYAPTATDLSSIVQAAKTKDPDVFLAAAHFQDSVLMVRQSKAAGFTPKIYAFGAAGPATAQFSQTVGAAAENIMGVSQWQPAATYPGNKKFVSEFTSTYNAEPSYTAAGGYGAGQLLKKAVEQAGSTDPQKVRDALASLDTTTVFGPYDVNDQGYQVAHETVLIQIQDGKQTIVYPSSAAQASPVIPFPGWK